MRMRWGLGPVFALESRLNARRRQVYAGRSFFVLLLLLGMAFIWVGRSELFGYSSAGREPTYEEMAAIGQGFFYALTGIQVSLVLLTAPAASAGSMGMDRARGTLLQMLVTDLSDVEIVLGTLAARLTPVCAMIVCGVPVTALAALLGGVDFVALAGAFAVSLALALLGCTLALTLSIWVTKTHEVLMAVYVAEGLWLLSLQIWFSLSGTWLPGVPAWCWKSNPYVLVFAPYDDPTFGGAVEYTVFIGVVLALCATLLGVSIACLRRVVVAQAGRREKMVRRRLVPWIKRLLPSWPSPTLDGNPVLWREWHRNRPSRLARWLWAGLLAVTWTMAAWGTYRVITEGVGFNWENTLQGGLMIQLVFGFLMLSAVAPTALAEERVRGSLDVLMASPLSTREIVVAKWWGAYRSVLMLLPLTLYTSIFLAATTPDLPVLPAGTRFPQPLVPLTIWDRCIGVGLCNADFLASGAMIVGLGLALAIWIRRMGRAIVLSVIAYFLAGIGWCFLVELSFSFLLRAVGIDPGRLFQDYYWLKVSMLALSPIAGPTGPIDVIADWYPRGPRLWPWSGLGVVLLIKTAAAGLLLWFSVATFDRRLGRVSEPRGPARVARPVVLEELATSVTT
jgi:ABC-type transport system involved in multi-copper enzyme maturation permease subunit